LRTSGIVRLEGRMYSLDVDALAERKGRYRKGLERKRERMRDVFDSERVHNDLRAMARACAAAQVDTVTQAPAGLMGPDLFAVLSDWQYGMSAAAVKSDERTKARVALCVQELAPEGITWRQWERYKQDVDGRLPNRPRDGVKLAADYRQFRQRQAQGARQGAQ
jgi:hypothetical protein